MIERMRKYTLIIYHSEYHNVMKELQHLGMLHIVKSTSEKSCKLQETESEIEAYAEASKFMHKWLRETRPSKITTLHPIQLRKQIEEAHLEKERLQLQFNVLAKEISDLETWGEFDYQQLNNLEKHNLKIDLYYCTRHHYKPDWEKQYTIQIINNIGHMVYFAIIHRSDELVTIDAELFKLPPRTLKELRQQEIKISKDLDAINEFYRDNSSIAIDMFSQEIEKLLHEYEFEEASSQSIPEADNHVLVLQGWIPLSLEDQLKDFIDKANLVHFSVDGTVEDNPPILLRNNPFAKIFEPIGKMFMLPYYNELDLTPFFAPFYMLFFGFCSGDAGYGIVLFLLGWFLKKKIKNPETRPFLTLIQALGIGTVIMGFVMGNFFAFDMKKLGLLNPYIPIRDTNQIFNFALLLGVIQIVTGKLLNAVKRMMQFGWIHGIAILGLTLFVLSLAIQGSTMLGANPGSLLKYTPYGMYAGLLMVFLLNSPGKSILFNIANGLWIMYGAVTGFFGDLLSYIRLFALGVSSGILGFVINTMAAQFGGIPIIGPVFFILFMLAGHGLNIALSSLGAFVHPMRLTFVEFFNNSGFAGPGIPYKPFGKQNQMIK